MITATCNLHVEAAVWWQLSARERSMNNVDEMLFKFATWNIGGGILEESHQRGTHPSLDYHLSVLKEHNPDVICLQEAHSYRDGKEDQLEYLARLSGYPYVASFPISESHLEEDAYLTLGILSRFPVAEAKYKQFPNPGLSKIQPDNTRWRIYDKGYVQAIVTMGGRALGLVNAHCFPLHYFDASPTEPRFAGMWEMLTADLTTMRQKTPTLVGIDLNYEPIQDLLIRLLLPGLFINAIESTPTIPRGIQQDYILYDHAMQLCATTVMPTRSDHSYCQATMRI
jgi:endonuclease/exonuclease/phosphatase family metal-dependent hydrolase